MNTFHSTKSRLSAIGGAALLLMILVGSLMNVHRDPPELVATVVRLQKLKRALDARLHIGAVPQSLEEFATSASTSEPLLTEDGWGRKVRFIKRGDLEYELRSAGPDGVFGSSDDVVVDQSEQ